MNGVLTGENINLRVYEMFITSFLQFSLYSLGHKELGGRTERGSGR